MTENEIATTVIGCAIDVHKKFGPGLLESSYREVLCHMLRKRGFVVEKEKPMPLVYEDIKLDCAIAWIC